MMRLVKNMCDFSCLREDFPLPCEIFICPYRNVETGGCILSEPDERYDKCMDDYKDCNLLG